MQAQLVAIQAETTKWAEAMQRVHLDLREVTHELAVASGLPDPLGLGNEPTEVWREARQGRIESCAWRSCAPHSFTCKVESEG